MRRESVNVRQEIKPFSTLDNIDIKLLAGALAMGAVGAATKSDNHSGYYSFGAYMATFIALDAGVRIYRSFRRGA